MLRPYSRLTEIADEKGKGTGKFKVLVDFPDQDENGHPHGDAHPETAVRRMKDLPQVYGNLFRSGVVSGIGSGSGPGTPTGGKIDLRKLTQEQYMEIRAKKPRTSRPAPQQKGSGVERLQASRHRRLAMDSGTRVGRQDRSQQP